MFLQVFSGLLIAFTVGYSVFLISILVGLFRLKQGTYTGRPQVTVIVPARDEERNIGACLQALTAQRYPPDKYEVVVVDDDSEDGTARIVNTFSKRYENIRLVQVSGRNFLPSPKKNAILCGIRESEGEIILTTDADCIPPPDWISGMVKQFEPQVGAVAGFSPSVRENSLKQNLIELESVSFAVLSAGAIGIGGAISCVGRNFGYRRDAFVEVGGFGLSGVAVSGDDDLLLQRIRRQGKWEIRFSASPDTFVPTLPSQGWTEFINRRKRHFSAGLCYPLPIRILGGMVYFYYLLLLLSFPVALVSGRFWIPLFCWAVKLALDTLVLFKGSRLLRSQKLLKLLPLAEVLHVPYLLVTWPLAIWGGFHWKGRSYH